MFRVQQIVLRQEITNLDRFALEIQLDSDHFTLEINFTKLYISEKDYYLGRKTYIHIVLDGKSYCVIVIL